MRAYAARAVIVALYVLCALGFLYFDFVNFTPVLANMLKFGTIQLSFLVCAYHWGEYFDPVDGTILLVAMFATVFTDIFLTYCVRHYAIGIVLYGFTMTIYFFRYQRRLGTLKRAVLLPFFLIIPLLLRFVFKLDPMTAAATYYIQVLITNLITVVQCARRGKYPKTNMVLILAGLFIFVLGDITVLLRHQFGIILASKFIYIFYAPSQAMLAFSGLKYKTE